MTAFDIFSLMVLPYVAAGVCLVGGIYRFFYKGFKVSSLSSQFLETKKLFWGIVPFHFGLMVVFFGHLIAFLFPRTLLLFNQVPIRLFILEITALVFALSFIYGLFRLFFRRLTHERVRMVTNRMDLFIEIILILQGVMGIYIAVAYRWGSSWFASVLTPYLWSVIKLSPQIDAVAQMPMMVKLHIFTAYVILLLIPFSRLIHMFAIPVHYLFRPFQRVVWNWNPREVRSASTPWSAYRPKNN